MELKTTIKTARSQENNAVDSVQDENEPTSKTGKKMNEKKTVVLEVRRIHPRTRKMKTLRKYRP